MIALEVLLYLFLISALGGGEGSASRPAALSTQKEHTESVCLLLAGTAQVTGVGA